MRSVTNEAITRLASLVPYGALMADTDPTAFLNAVFDGLVDARAKALSAANEERAAVIHWLRSALEFREREAKLAIYAAANAIERGEHRR